MGDLLVVILVLAVAVPLIIFQKSRHEALIKEKISQIGGTYIDHNREIGLLGAGPFKLVGRGQTVYHINYRIGVQAKEGWVRFGGLGGPDWRV